MLKILLIHLHDAFTIAVDFAHDFIRTEEECLVSEKEKEICLNHIGEPQPFWQIMSFFSPIIVFILAFYESQNVALILTNFLDPNGAKNILFTWFMSLIGFVITFAVIFFSHSLSELMQKKFDPHSGKYFRKLGVGFYTLLAILITYVLLHLLIIQFDFKGSLFLGFVAVCIACFEIVFGMLIFGKAIRYIKLYFVNIRIKMLKKRMSAYSKKTHVKYFYYIHLLEKYNDENPHNMKKPKWNKAVARAISFFGGEKMPAPNEDFIPDSLHS
jgi:hypothetical protein